MHWVLIETGSNQPYIFSTNKQRLQLAASREIRMLGEDWVKTAVDDVNTQKADSAEHVVRASGTGMIRVVDVETGRQIVRQVTERAIERQTGLDVWGYVHDVDDGGDPDRVASELANAQRQHGLVRSQRLSPLVQALNNPFEQQCSFTGRPAVPDDGKDSKAVRGQQRSRAVQELWNESQHARDDIRKYLRTLAPEGEDHLDASEDWVIDSSVVSWDRLREGDDIRNNGWVGVLHADGNGIGSVFSHLLDIADGERSFLDLETELSKDLGGRMWRIVAHTIVDCQRNNTIGGKTPTDWVLPIVIGGDDVTMVLHGGMAWDFTRRLIDNFAASFQEGPFPKVLQQIKDKLTEKGQLDVAATIPETLTLGAGLVFVKPHHPFSHAVTLAEQLASSAKKWCKPHGGVDVEVLFESAVRDLDAIRESQQVGDGKDRYLRYGGPFIVTNDHKNPRNISHLDDLVESLRTSDISRNILHSLREVIDTDTTKPDQLRRILERTFATLGARRDVDQGLVALLGADALTSTALLPDSPPGARAESFTRIVTALDLIDVAQGTAAARTAGDADNEGTDDDADQESPVQPATKEAHS